MTLEDPAIPVENENSGSKLEETANGGQCVSSR